MTEYKNILTELIKDKATLYSPRKIETIKRLIFNEMRFPFLSSRFFLPQRVKPLRHRWISFGQLLDGDSSSLVVGQT
jgi:hypothetical protein